LTGTQGDFGYITTNSCGTTTLSNACGLWVSGNMIQGALGGPLHGAGDVRIKVSSNEPFTQITFIDDPDSSSIVEQGKLSNFVLTPYICNLPTPVLSATTLNIPCGQTTANLTTINSSNLPVATCNNYSLTWHTATPATTANTVANPAAVGAGTYYASFYNSGTYCYSPTTSVEVTVSGGTTPTFNFANTICFGTVVNPLPTTSNNGITGTWSPATVSNTTSGTYTFTPTAAGGCLGSLAITITVIQGCNIEIASKLATMVPHGFCYSSTLTQTSPQSIYDLASGAGAGYAATIGGVPCNGSNVYIANITPPFPAGYSINPNGFPIVAAGTLPFQQRFTFDICPVATPGSNCVNVIYDASVRGGVRPIGETIYVLPSGTICNGPSNIFDNDTIENCTNGTSIPANATNTTLTVLGSSTNFNITTSGQIQFNLNNPLALNTTASITYQLCNNALAGNCRTATVYVRTVASCSVYKTANNNGLKNENNFDLNETIVAPNPSTGMFNIQFNDLIIGTATIEVYNLLGQKMYVENVENKKEHQIDLTKLSLGNYILKVLFNYETMSKQIIKK